MEKPETTQDFDSESRRSLDELGKSAAEVIQEAAAVLEEELAAGLIAARRVSHRLATEQRIETEDFAEALKRFRSTGHELIEVARGRVDEMTSDTTRELANQFITDAQGALDVVVDLIAAGPELAKRFLESKSGDPAEGNSES